MFGKYSDYLFIKDQYTYYFFFTFSRTMQSVCLILIVTLLASTKVAVTGEITFL